MLQRIEALSGRPVEFKPDAALTLRATLQLARNGAASHVLRYRPTSEPLPYRLMWKWLGFETAETIAEWRRALLATRVPEPER